VVKKQRIRKKEVTMSDFYDRGFKHGHRDNGLFDDSKPPQNSGNEYDYKRGFDDGSRRRKYSDEYDDNDTY